MIPKNILSNKLIAKLSLTFTLLIILMGSSYMFLTYYFTYKFQDETIQRLNASLANDLIEEKFNQSAPFLANGDVNKALFGDLMHDMMAVNRGIEVHLLDKKGSVLYSVALDPNDFENNIRKVDLKPIEKFISENGTKYIVGDNPRIPGEKSIFSAAKFNYKGREAYIYIILKSKRLQSTTSALSNNYFLHFGSRIGLLSMFFVLLLGFFSIWFLTKNLREIILTVKRFQEGDYDIRVENPENSDLSVLAHNFNSMADTIVKNMDEIKSVDQLRRELIANVSHDLRTPLAVLKGYIDTLQIKRDVLSSEEKEKYLKIISNSASKLSSLIYQLFEYSKLEAKQVELKKEPFSITDLALDLIANNKVIAEQKEIDIQLIGEQSVPLVFADLALVERAIQNLIDNAIKFTPKGGRIQLHIASDNTNVKIKIVDNGIGIKSTNQSSIFERYRQT